MVSSDLEYLSQGQVILNVNYAKKLLTPQLRTLKHCLFYYGCEWCYNW